jgi:hypothetical protein
VDDTMFSSEELCQFVSSLFSKVVGGFISFNKLRRIVALSCR